jgi:diguanylate cyclase (GGDEF)-like protein
MDKMPDRVAALKKSPIYSFNHIVCLTFILMLCIYTIYFALLRQTMLSAVNGAGLLFCLFCLPLLHKKLYKASGLLSFLTLIVVCAINLQHTGWQSGFQYYYLCVCPFVFLDASMRIRSKIVICFICIALFIVLKLLLSGSQPLAALRTDTLALMLDINLFIIFAGLSSNIYHYSLSAYRYEYKLRTVNNRLHMLAETDHLTTLYNRRYFLQAVEQETAVFDIKQKPFVLAIIDIDNFKSVNDTYGHNEGDKALVAISQCIRLALRKEDIVARWGGEEFIALLPQTSVYEGLTAMEKVRKAIERIHISYKGRNYTLTVTIGISCYTGRQKMSELIKSADMNLYTGKQSGKNCVVA